MRSRVRVLGRQEAECPAPGNGAGHSRVRKVIRGHGSACRVRCDAKIAMVLIMTITCGPVARASLQRGPLVAPKIDGPLDVAGILAEIEGREYMRFPELGRQIGLGPGQRAHVIREGLVTVIPCERKSAGNKVARDEALTLLLAAALAVAAGVAIAVMLRGVRETGLTGESAASVLRTMKT